MQLASSSVSEQACRSTERKSRSNVNAETRWRRAAFCPDVGMSNHATFPRVRGERRATNMVSKAAFGLINRGSSRCDPKRGQRESTETSSRKRVGCWRTCLRLIWPVLVRFRDQAVLQWTTRRERGVKKGRLDGDVSRPIQPETGICRSIRGNPFAAMASKSTATTVPMTTGLGVNRPDELWSRSSSKSTCLTLRWAVTLPFRECGETLRLTGHRTECPSQVFTHEFRSIKTVLSALFSSSSSRPRHHFRFTQTA